MRGMYTLNGETAKQIIRQKRANMAWLSRELGYSYTWMYHALNNGRMHRDAFNKLKEYGINLEKAVIARPESLLINTNVGRIVRTINLRYKGYPVWVIADVERMSKDKVTAHLHTWEQTRFGLTKEDIEELLRNWNKEDETAFVKNTDGQG